MKRFTISMLTFALSMTLGISQSQAQCSRGQRSPGGGGALQLADSFTQNSLNSRPSANLTALQMQLFQLQQQLMAMRNQQLQQIAQQRISQQQALQAGRLARAEAKRAKRAERIAALKAQRAAESSESAIMLATRSQAKTVEGDPSADLR